MTNVQYGQDCGPEGFFQERSVFCHELTTEEEVIVVIYKVTFMSDDGMSMKLARHIKLNPTR